MKRTLRIGGIALGVLILVLLILPLLINVNSFRPKVESEASTALGRQVTVGNLSLSILSGSVGADNIAIADDPAFSKSPFVTAKSLKIGVELIPLIFSKQLNVTDVTLDEPQIMLLKAANGKWNFSSLGGASAPKQSGSGSAPASFSIAKLNVKDGKLLIGKSGFTVKAATYNDVNIKVTDFSLTSQFPFEFTADLPGGGDANISGKAGPINATDAAKTPLETAVKVRNLNIAASGMVDPASGIAGIADFDGTLNSNGSQAKAVGVLTGKHLKFSPKGTPAPRTVTIKHAVDLDLDRETGTITQGDIAAGSAQAHLTGSFQSRGDSEVVNLRLNAPNLPVDEVESLLPAMGVVLPSGSQLKGGTISADLGITGPLEQLVITGPVRLSNSQLANFDLGSKLAALQAFTGKSASSRDTTIQTASLNARVAPEGTRADNINLTVPAIGVITGAGTINPAGALAFKMQANLSGGVAGGLTRAAAPGIGNGPIPFAIEGTTSNPKFVPDVGSMIGGLAAGQLGNLANGQGATPNKLTQSLSGLLGHKKH